MEEQVKVNDQNESAIDNNKLSKSAIEEETISFLDSLDQYLVLIDSLSNTLLRQGWLELAGARYSMGASRVNTALLNLQPHSAPTTVDVVTHDDDGSIMTKSPKFSLCKWASTDNKDSSLEKENIEEDEQLKENISSQRDSVELQKERAKVLSMFGTLVSPKLRASQLTFETALETLVEIANARSRILKSYEALHRDMKSTKE
ncbi:coiled-coil domain-containing protein 115 [Tanacetum coccineum]